MFKSSLQKLKTLLIQSMGSLTQQQLA